MHQYKIIIFTLVVLLLILQISPDLDISVSHIFFDTLYEEFLLSSQSFKLYFDTWTILSALVPMLVLWSKILKKKLCKLHITPDELKECYFIAIILLVFGVLLPQFVLKPYFGRTRPFNLIEFGGEEKFSPILTALATVQECQHNCSLPSGHCCTIFSSIYLLFTKQNHKHMRKYIITSIVIVTIISIARGAHYLSDIIFSAFYMMVSAIMTKKIINIASRKIFKNT